MIDKMSRAHDEDVAGWILRPHFDSTNEGKTVRNPANQGKNLKCPVDEGKTIRNLTNEGKTVRNPADQGKNLKCPAGESKTIRNLANEGKIHFKFYLIKCSKISPLLLIQS